MSGVEGRPGGGVRGTLKPPRRGCRPEKIENVYTRSPLLAQAFVYGDSLKTKLVAVFVPDPDVLGPWAAARGLAAATEADLAALCTREDLRAEVQASLEVAEKDAGLHGFERVRAFVLSAEPFSVENGLLTPTFKLKRQQCRDRFEAEVARMYAQLGE